jgi:hypothetical protein
MDLLKDYRCRFMLDSGRLYVDDRPDSAGDSPRHDLLLDSKAHPYVDVGFATATVRAVWDSGASLTLVDLSFIQEHPALFTPVGTSTGTDATGASSDTPMFTMHESRIGGHAFAACRVAGVDLTPIRAAAEIPMEMIIGYNIIRQANWLFDFPQRKWAVLA